MRAHDDEIAAVRIGGFDDGLVGACVTYVDRITRNPRRFCGIGDLVEEVPGVGLGAHLIILLGDGNGDLADGNGLPRRSYRDRSDPCVERLSELDTVESGTLGEL